MAIRKLNAKQEAFCREYLIDLNATQAAIRAGYKEKWAGTNADKLLKNTNVAARIKELMAERSERTQINADSVLVCLVEIHEMDIADILNDDWTVKPLSEWPKVWRRALTAFDISELWEGSGEEREISGLLKKFKWPDKLKNLELIGKHVGVNAFKDTIDHNHKGYVRSITRTIVDPQPPKKK